MSGYKFPALPKWVEEKRVKERAEDNKKLIALFKEIIRGKRSKLNNSGKWNVFTTSQLRKKP